MDWLVYASYFAGGAVLANGVPHFVSGVTGRSFQTPFAKPPAQGLSSSTVNVLWGFLNFVIGYVLICRIGSFDLTASADAVALGLGMLSMALVLARLFGRFHGGGSPANS